MLATVQVTHPIEYSSGTGAGEADFEAFDFAGPAFAFGFGDAGGEVVADLCEPVALGRVGPLDGAADAPLTELTLTFGQVAECFRCRAASLAA
jgi:hypothetical protein